MSSYKRLLILVTALAVSVSGYMNAWAFSGPTGPPDQRTGAPGESTCQACHSSFELNSGEGGLSISAPSSYALNQTYTITVSLADPGQTRWGFELTVLDSNDNMAGTLANTDDNAQTSTNGGRQYIKHTTAGTFAGTANASPGWSFEWTAPASDVGPVKFYAAGNGANNNSSSSGDFIYTTSTGDVPLPVQLATFTGTSTSDGVSLSWRTLSEINNAGFHVYRSQTQKGEYQRVTQNLIEGRGTDSTPRDYRFVDTTTQSGETYWYQIEDVAFDGATKQSDPIEVVFHRQLESKNKVTMLWASLKRRK